MVVIAFCSSCNRENSRIGGIEYVVVVVVDRKGKRLTVYGRRDIPAEWHFLSRLVPFSLLYPTLFSTSTTPYRVHLHLLNTERGSHRLTVRKSTLRGPCRPTLSQTNYGSMALPVFRLGPTARHTLDSAPDRIVLKLSSGARLTLADWIPWKSALSGQQDSLIGPIPWGQTRLRQNFAA